MSTNTRSETGRLFCKLLASTPLMLALAFAIAMLIAAILG